MKGRRRGRPLRQRTRRRPVACPVRRSPCRTPPALGRIACVLPSGFASVGRFQSAQVSVARAGFSPAAPHAISDDRHEGRDEIVGVVVAFAHVEHQAYARILHRVFELPCIRPFCGSCRPCPDRPEFGEIVHRLRSARRRRRDARRHGRCRDISQRPERTSRLPSD